MSPSTGDESAPQLRKMNVKTAAGPCQQAPNADAPASRGGCAAQDGVPARQRRTGRRSAASTEPPSVATHGKRPRRAAGLRSSRTDLRRSRGLWNTWRQIGFGWEFVPWGSGLSSAPGRIRRRHPLPPAFGASPGRGTDASRCIPHGACPRAVFVLANLDTPPSGCYASMRID
jgi:hypothetical protein